MPAISIMMKPASGLCNMRCNYCFYSDETSKREICSYGIMSLNTLEQILQKTLAFAEGSCSILFQGGEPTLAGLDFFKSVVELEHKWNINHVNIQNSIQTNGFLINENWAKFFHDHNFLVGLSLDGTREVHDACRKDSNQEGTFDKVLHTIELFKKYHVEFNILTVVTKHTTLHTKEIYSFYKNMGFEWQQYIPCLNPLDEFHTNYDYSLNSKDYTVFLKDLFDCWYEEAKSGHLRYVRFFIGLMNLLCRRAPGACEMNGVCSRQFVIEADGSVFPCDFYMLDEWLLGNFTHDSIEDIEKKREELHFIETSTHLDSSCKNCKWIYLCRGGCRRDRIPLEDGLFGKNRHCESFRDFFEYAYPRLVEIVNLYS